jgi:hypothetical protein
MLVAVEDGLETSQQAVVSRAQNDGDGNAKHNDRYGISNSIPARWPDDFEQFALDVFEKLQYPGHYFPFNYAKYLHIRRLF